MSRLMESSSWVSNVPKASAFPFATFVSFIIITLGVGLLSMVCLGIQPFFLVLIIEVRRGAHVQELLPSRLPHCREAGLLLL